MTCSSSGTATISTRLRPGSDSARTRACASDEPPPMLRPPERPLEPGRRDFQHIPRPDHRPGFQETFEGPADRRTVVGRHSLARAAVRAVHPYLQDGALQRAGSPEIDQLEPEPGNVIANRSQQRVGRHRRRRKKNVGELPHIDSRPKRAPPGTAAKYYCGKRVGVKRERASRCKPPFAHRCLADRPVAIERRAVMGRAPGGAGHLRNAQRSPPGSASRSRRSRCHGPGSFSRQAAASHHFRAYLIARPTNADTAMHYDIRAGPQPQPAADRAPGPGFHRRSPASRHGAMRCLGPGATRYTGTQSAIVTVSRIPGLVVIHPSIPSTWIQPRPESSLMISTPWT